MRNVTPKEAHQLINDEGYVYVDVRTEEEFESGHATGAVNIPVVFAGMQPNNEFLSVVTANYAPETKIVFGCKSGGRSARACGMLEAAGYTDVVNMDGGFHGRYGPTGAVAQPGWSQESLPVSDDNGEGVSYASLRSKQA